MIRAFLREVGDLVETFFEGLGLMIGSGLGLLLVASIFWFAWEVVVALI